MADEKGKFYAHSKEGAPREQWQLLEDHLKNTAKLAGEMAAELGCSEWGYLAGLWHFYRGPPVQPLADSNAINS